MNPAVQTSVPSQKFWIHQRERGRQGEEEEILTGTESKQTDTDTHTHTHTDTHTHRHTHTYGDRYKKNIKRARQKEKDTTPQERDLVSQVKPIAYY